MFLFLMLLPLRIASSLTAAFFCSLSTNTMSGWFAITSLSVWIWKSPRIYALLFSTTCRCVSHFDFGTSNPYSAQMFLHTIPATCLWCSMYLPASHTLLLRAGLSQKPLCTACTWGPVCCGRPQPLLLLCSEPVFKLP